MSLLLLIQDLQLALEGLDLVLFGLDGLVVVDAIELPLGHEDTRLHLFQFDLLLLDLEAFLANELVLFLDLGEVYAVVFLFGLVFKQNFVKLLS